MFFYVFYLQMNVFNIYALHYSKPSSNCFFPKLVKFDRKSIFWTSIIFFSWILQLSVGNSHLLIYPNCYRLNQRGVIVADQTYKQWKVVIVVKLEKHSESADLRQAYKTMLTKISK